MGEWVGRCLVDTDTRVQVSAPPGGKTRTRSTTARSYKSGKTAIRTRISYSKTRRRRKPSKCVRVSGAGTMACAAAPSSARRPTADGAVDNYTPCNCSHAPHAYTYHARCAGNGECTRPEAMAHDSVIVEFPRADSLRADNTVARVKKTLRSIIGFFSAFPETSGKKLNSCVSPRDRSRTWLRGAYRRVIFSLSLYLSFFSCSRRRISLEPRVRVGSTSTCARQMHSSLLRPFTGGARVIYTCTD